MKNSSKAALFGCGLLVTLLSGCATVPNTDMKPEARQNLHSIAMLDVIEPKRVAVVNFGGAAGGFGLIGALAQGAVNASHTSTYTDHVAAGKIVFAPDIAEGVAGRLTGNGYQVVKLDGQKVKLADDGKSDDYSAIQTDADAIMNVWFTSFGYISPPNQLDYVPWVRHPRAHSRREDEAGPLLQDVRVRLRHQGEQRPRRQRFCLQVRQLQQSREEFRQVGGRDQVVREVGRGPDRSGSGTYACAGHCCCFDGIDDDCGHRDGHGIEITLTRLQDRRDTRSESGSA